MKKVEMSLDTQDSANAEFICGFFGLKTKVLAVRTALSVTRSILESIKKGGQLQVRYKNGMVSDIHIG